MGTLLRRFRAPPFDHLPNLDMVGDREWSCSVVTWGEGTFCNLANITELALEPFLPPIRFSRISGRAKRSHFFCVVALSAAECNHSTVTERERGGSRPLLLDLWKGRLPAQCSGLVVPALLFRERWLSPAPGSTAKGRSRAVTYAWADAGAGTWADK